MQFTEAVQTCFNKYVMFSGRASRSEFWYWVVFILLCNAVLAAADRALLPGMVDATGSGAFTGLFGLIVLLPGLSVSVRRLHDTGRSGWWWWIVLIPVIGWIVLLVFYAGHSDAGPNAYGEEPAEARAFRLKNEGGAA